jgi:hypothetical protein
MHVKTVQVEKSSCCVGLKKNQKLLQKKILQKMPDAKTNYHSDLWGMMNQMLPKAQSLAGHLTGTSGQQPHNPYYQVHDYMKNNKLSLSSFSALYYFIFPLLCMAVGVGSSMLWPDYTVSSRFHLGSWIYTMILCKIYLLFGCSWAHAIQHSKDKFFNMCHILTLVLHVMHCISCVKQHHLWSLLSLYCMYALNLGMMVNWFHHGSKWGWVSAIFVAWLHFVLFCHLSLHQHIPIENHNQQQQQHQPSPFFL